MSIKFREEPRGELELKLGGTQVLRRKNRPVLQKDEPKMAFSAEPVRNLGGRGCWFEIRVDVFAGGEMCVMGLGFTATDPETLINTAEGEAPPLPGCAGDIPRTFVAGYGRSLYWNGERIEIEPVFAKLKPAQAFTVGALANLDGGLELFINRRLVYTFSPEANVKAPIEVDAPLWAVVDCSGGLKKASLIPDSVLPTPEEAALGEEDEKVPDTAAEAEAGEPIAEAGDAA
ncbi:Glrx5 [Symbiodinium natans]|uniref:Glrx5 protein n=1 Tax=Symbiodinium natans TaxID=878477 RepID=A0A812NC90_9DINO|nr:Glrx5 [Symbiodinium natans]